MNRDQVRGILFGTAIGDALGMPVETWTRDQIDVTFGRITNYLRPDGHKWFGGRGAGTTTDDTSLTLATAYALIRDGCFNMTSIEEQHVIAFRDYGPRGWGGSTRGALTRRMGGGGSKRCGVQPQGKGQGNGVSMKSAILAPYFLTSHDVQWSIAFKNKTLDLPYDLLHEFEQMIRFALFTHATPIAAASCAAMVGATIYCLECDPTESRFSDRDFCKFSSAMSSHACQLGGMILRERGISIQKIGHRTLTARLKDAYQMNDDQLATELEGGTSWVANSLPFSFAHFCRHPYSIDALYNVVSAGGDTDTNGAQVGALLGALNGMKVFPPHLVEGLKIREEIERVTEQFCDRFGIAE